MIDINEYNRRDIIASCLLEAVDIMKEQEEYDNYNNELLYEDELYESAGRNGVGDRYRDAKLVNVDKEIKSLRSKGNLSKEEERRLDKLMYSRMYLKGSHGGSDISTPGSKYFGKAYARKASPTSVNHGNIDLGRQSARMSKQISDGYGGTDYGYEVKPSGTYTYYDVDKYDRSNRKVSPIHKKINDRARAKSMNESAYDDIELADMILDIID